MNHALVQDRSLDLLTSTPERYHCTMDTPFITIDTEEISTEEISTEEIFILMSEVLIYSSFIYSYTIRLCNAVCKQLMVMAESCFIAVSTTCS